MNPGHAEPIQIFTGMVNPDKTVTAEADWSRSTLFAWALVWVYNDCPGIKLFKHTSTRSIQTDANTDIDNSISEIQYDHRWKDDSHAIMCQYTQRFLRHFSKIKLKKYDFIIWEVPFLPYMVHEYRMQLPKLDFTKVKEIG